LLSYLRRSATEHEPGVAAAADPPEEEEEEEEEEEGPDFEDVLAVIDANYSFDPVSFSHGDVTNDAGTNVGSCKLLGWCARTLCPHLAPPAPRRAGECAPCADTID
jgi:hypothetical protein